MGKRNHRHFQERGKRNSPEIRIIRNRLPISGIKHFAHIEYRINTKQIFGTFLHKFRDSTFIVFRSVAQKGHRCHMYCGRCNCLLFYRPTVYVQTTVKATQRR